MSAQKNRRGGITKRFQSPVFRWYGVSGSEEAPGGTGGCGDDACVVGVNLGRVRKKRRKVTHGKRVMSKGRDCLDSLIATLVKTRPPQMDFRWMRQSLSE